MRRWIDIPFWWKLLCPKNLSVEEGARLSWGSPLLISLKPLSQETEDGVSESSMRTKEWGLFCGRKGKVTFKNKGTQARGDGLTVSSPSRLLRCDGVVLMLNLSLWSNMIVWEVALPSNYHQLSLLKAAQHLSREILPCCFFPHHTLFYGSIFFWIDNLFSLKGKSNQEQESKSN